MISYVYQNLDSRKLLNLYLLFLPMIVFVIVKVFLIRSSLKCIVFNELINMKPHIQSIFVENQNLIAGNIYRNQNRCFCYPT